MRVPFTADTLNGAGLIPSVVLDLRQPPQFVDERTALSYNIPAEELPHRSNELPSKSGTYCLYVVVDSETLAAAVEALRSTSESGATSTAHLAAELRSQFPHDAESLALQFLLEGKWPLEMVTTISRIKLALAALRELDSGVLRPGGMVEGASSQEELSRFRSDAWKVVTGHSPWTLQYPPPRMWAPSPLLEHFIGHIEMALGGPGVCLDIGCGSGRDLAYLAARGWTCLGVDNRRSLLRQATAFVGRYTAHAASGHRTPSLPHLIEMTADRRLPLRPRSVDLLLVVRFLHRPLLDCLIHVIRDGGFVLYSHFVDGVQHSAVGRPRDPSGYLFHGELRTHFASGTRSLEACEVIPVGESTKRCVVQTDYQVERLVDEETTLPEDGRPIVNFVACVRSRELLEPG